jgi:hypothetical protein
LSIFSKLQAKIKMTRSRRVFFVKKPSDHSFFVNRTCGHKTSFLNLYLYISLIYILALTSFLLQVLRMCAQEQLVGG